MKKQLSLILAAVMVLSLAACGQTGPQDLMEEIPAKVVDVLPDMDTGSAAAADFAVRLFQASMEEDKNTLISPLSVLYALAMTANGADGETLAQMEEVLGLDPDTLNGYMRAWMDLLPQNENAKMSLANSIWFKDDPLLTVKPEFLQVNADYYGTEVYKTAFDDQTLTDINDWVREHTEEMIPQILDRIPDEAVMYLINALAFEARWQTVYDETQVREGTFTTVTGEEQLVTMMHSEEGLYLEDEQATGFIKYYEGRSYAFAALLPNTGVSLREYVQGLTGAHLQKLLSEPQEITVFAQMPKFETEYDSEMSSILEEMGMTDAFHWQTADFSRLGTYDADGVNIFINRVLHKTFISVAEQGTRAGASTIVEMAAEGAAILPDYRTVSLDQPFLYMLIDTQTNLPFFIGTMQFVS